MLLIVRAVIVVLIFAFPMQTWARAYMSKDSAQKLQSYFKYVKFDTLHVHAAAFAPNSGKSIPYSLLRNQKLQLDSAAYEALICFPISPDSNILGYLVQQQNQPNQHRTVYMFARNKKSGQILLQMEIACYTYLEGTMEQTVNTWITDINGDGHLDLATRKYIRDFEMPTDDAPNITGEEKYTHVFQKWRFYYRTWPAGLLSESVLKK